jgi:hypothetical protein
MLRTLSVLCAAVALLSTTRADSLLLGDYRSNHLFSDTDGYWFSVGVSDLSVTALGVYDNDYNGLAAANKVGLWTKGGDLLASVVVPRGTTPALVDGFRYSFLASSVTLAAGHDYVLGVVNLPNNGFVGDTRAEVVVRPWDSSPFVTVGGIARSHPGSFSPDLDLFFPGQFTDDSKALVGPNLLFTVVEPPPPPPAVPDAPATLLLCCGALGVLAAGRRLVPRPPE